MGVPEESDRGKRRGAAWFAAGALLAAWCFHGPPWPLTAAANLAPVLALLAAVAAPFPWLAARSAGARRGPGRRRVARCAAGLAGFGLAGAAIQGARWTLPRPPAPSANGSAPARELSVVTFNLGTDLADAPRLARWLRELEPDLVALQELTELTAGYLAEQLGELYPHGVLVPGGGPGGVHGRGILSRYPVLDWSYPKLRQPRRHLRARLGVGGRALDVWVLHLSAETSVLGAGTAGGRDLIELSGRGEPGVPRLVLGDLNTTERSGDWRRLRAAGLTDAFRAVERRAGYSFPLHRRYRGIPAVPFVRIDYVWHSAEFRALSAELGPDLGSDHLPLSVALEFP